MMTDAIPTYTVVRMYADKQGRNTGLQFRRLDEAIWNAIRRADTLHLPYGVLCLDTNRIVYTTDPKVAA